MRFGHNEDENHSELMPGEVRRYEMPGYSLLLRNEPDKGISSVTMFSDKGNLFEQRTVLAAKLYGELQDEHVVLAVKTGSKHKVALVGIQDVYANNSLSVIGNRINNAYFKRYILEPLSDIKMIPQEMCDEFPKS